MISYFLIDPTTDQLPNVIESYYDGHKATAHIFAITVRSISFALTQYGGIDLRKYSHSVQP
jgi:hypothetical protein